jgi:CRISPR-associated protein Csx14
MVTTLGGQPQVVTFALDALLDQGIDVTRVLALYLPGGHQSAHSLSRLAIEFADGSYRGRPMLYSAEAVADNTTELDDIRDESDADAVWRAVNHRIAGLKARNETVHLCISGGRRLLGLLAMSAAMLHFGHQDVLWHMYTPAEIQDEAQNGALMHLPSDSGFQLIRVPMMPWGTYFPVLRELAQPPSGADVLARPRQLLDSVERARCRKVLDHLTARQKDVLRLLADGHNPQNVAVQLGVELSTIDSHKTVILAECRNAWNLPDEVWLDYRFVREKFEGYPHGL